MYVKNLVVKMVEANAQQFLLLSWNKIIYINLLVQCLAHVWHSIKLNSLWYNKWVISILVFIFTQTKDFSRARTTFFFFLYSSVCVH